MLLLFWTYYSRTVETIEHSTRDISYYVILIIIIITVMGMAIKFIIYLYQGDLIIRGWRGAAIRTTHN